MQLSKFNGVFPPVPTIVDVQGRLDRKGMAALIDHLIGAGVHGFLFLGSGGEFCNMTKEMRFEVAEFAVECVNKRVPVMLGISSTSTAETIAFGAHADRLGVDAALVLNPYYALLNDDYIFNHFCTVAANIKTPVILYNFPALTKQDLKVGLIRRLAGVCPNIIGIKDTVDNISHIREIINMVRTEHPEFIIFSGYDEYMMDALILGANGGIPATANFAAHITCGIYDAFRKKEYERMHALQRQLSRLSSIYNVETPFFGVIKEAIKQTGVNISTETLPPVKRLSEEKRKTVTRILEFSNVIANPD